MGIPVPTVSEVMAATLDSVADAARDVVYEFEAHTDPCKIERAEYTVVTLFSRFALELRARAKQLREERAAA